MKVQEFDYPEKITTAAKLAVYNAYNPNYSGLNFPWEYQKEAREKALREYNFDSESDHMKKKVETDFLIMKDIQEKRDSKKDFCTGDYLLIGDEIHRICVFLDEKTCQVGSLYGSYHISKYGTGSYSGGCGEVVDLSNTKKQGKKPAYFWMWHHNWPGASKSIQVIINVNVWLL